MTRAVFLLFGCGGNGGGAIGEAKSSADERAGERARLSGSNCARRRRRRLRRAARSRWQATIS